MDDALGLVIYLGICVEKYTSKEACPEVLRYNLKERIYCKHTVEDQTT
jgi:hypothetical protein